MGDGVFWDENSYFPETFALKQLVRLLLLVKQAINLQINRQLSFARTTLLSGGGGGGGRKRKRKKNSYLKEAPVTLLRR